MSTFYKNYDIGMKRLLIFFLFGFTLLFDSVVAQQDPQYSQYMFNQLAINPGYAGSRDAICASALHRQQWVGMDGAPVTSIFSANMPFRLFGQNHGVGFMLMNDELGFDQNISIGLDYTYRLNVGPGKLGIGISGILLNKALAASWYIPNGTPESDPSIPKADESVMGFDMGLGLFYNAERVYLGLSTTHLLQPKMKYENPSTDFTLRRHYYLTAGCSIPLRNPVWELNPSMMAYSDGISSQLSMNVNVMYNKKIWGGIGYRLNDAIVAMIGIDLFSGLKLGYSYDYSYTNIRRYSSGSHEIVLSYCFSLVKEKVVKKYKSVRFL
ncbi:MAG: type IX secretion system membrane protein PorP/SprF [Bacteroidales bacterium]|jgi:type IX secretion system PorP/SprF family membrane protein|nr:type IX secretion system membrane protein PorP/SprF [Bacteroidales bacterium]